jgi:hypothetical protein
MRLIRSPCCLCIHVNLFVFYPVRVIWKESSWLVLPELLVLNGWNEPEDELTEIRNGRKLNLKQSSTDTASFRLSLRQEYPIKATEALLPVSTSCLCEAGFPTMNRMKSKNRSRLQTLEEDLRVCLSIIRPRTRGIMTRHQAQASHCYFNAYIKNFYLYSCLYLKNIFLLSLYLL